MKKIEAIIRPESLTAVKNALDELGYPGITITDVKGHGKQKGKDQVWRGREYKVEFLPKTKIEIVVLDEDAGNIARAIMRGVVHWRYYIDIFAQIHQILADQARVAIHTVIAIDIDTEGSVDGSPGLTQK